MKRLTKEQGAILSAFTGVLCGPFTHVHEYAEKKLGRPVWNHEFANKEFHDDLKKACKEDFMKICVVEEE